MKAPAWCKNAVPTVRGWEDPVTGEVYKKQKFTADQLAEWHGTDEPEPAPEPVPEPEEVVEEDSETEE